MRQGRIVDHQGRPFSFGHAKIESVDKSDGRRVEFVLGPIKGDGVQPDDAAIVVADGRDMEVIAQRDMMWLNVIVDYRVRVTGVGLMEMIGR